MMDSINLRWDWFATSCTARYPFLPRESIEAPMKFVGMTTKDEHKRDGGPEPDRLVTLKPWLWDGGPSKSPILKLSVIIKGGKMVNRDDMPHHTIFGIPRNTWIVS